MDAVPWKLLFVIAAPIWMIGMSVWIVLERRSPVSTIAWLFALAFLPGIGWLVYRVIGPRRLERKRLKRVLTRKVVMEAVGVMREIESDAPERHREQLAKVAIAAGEPPPLRADSLALFTEGFNKYGAVVEAIAAARHHIHVEYYIWQCDETGRMLRDKLIERARAGVEVRVIVDGTGAWSVRGAFFDALRAAGGQVAWFNPPSLVGSVLRIRRRRVDFRSHRKIVVCDGTVGFTGGMNVADEENSQWKGDQAWRDTHIRITGSAVRALQRVFAEDWLYASEQQLPTSEAYFPQPTSAGSEVVQIVASGPDDDTFAVHKTFFAAINVANHRLWLTTPYFVPDESIEAALVSAAMRGVDVRIIAPAKGDSRLVDLAARSYFPEIIRAGGRIFEYQPRFVHAKTFVVDDDIGIVTTANLDNRSFRLDFEVSAIVYGGDINRQLAEIFEADLLHCREVKKGEEDKLSFRQRLGRAGARLLSPLL